MRMPSVEKVTSNRVELRRPSAGMVEITFTGHIDGNIMAPAVAALNAAGEREAIHVVVFEATGITGFETSVRGPGSALLSSTKRFGALGIAAIRATPVRMMATTLAFATGLPLRIVAAASEARDLAEVELARRRRR